MSLATLTNIEVPVTRGEIVHPDEDWAARVLEYADCTDHASKMRFFAEKLPGSAAVGCVADSDKMIPRLMEAQRYIDAIFALPQNANKTGEELGLLGTPGVMCSTLAKFVIANSKVLTPSDLVTASAVHAHGPAEYAMVFMPRETADGGFASVHFEGAILPKDTQDGQPLLHAIHWAYTDDQTPLPRKYIVEKFNASSLGIGALTTDYGRMLGSREGEIKNGRTAIILPLREEDWNYTMSEVLAHAIAKHATPTRDEAYSRSINPVHAVALWPLTTDQHSSMLHVEALFKIALQRDEVLNYGILNPCNSCGAFPSAMIASILPPDVYTPLEAQATPLDTLALKLISLAPTLLWVKSSKQGFIYDITSAKRTDVFDEITRDDAMERMRKIFTHPEMFKMQPIKGFASFGNQYTTFRKPHPNSDARTLYEEAFAVMVADLKIRAGF